MWSSQEILGRSSVLREACTRKSLGVRNRAKRRPSLILRSNQDIVFRNRFSRFAWTRAMAMLVTFFGCLTLHAQKPKPGEYDVKAVYLYSFGKFVRWPAETLAKSDSFPICVLGNDPFGSSL